MSSAAGSIDVGAAQLIRILAAMQQVMGPLPDRAHLPALDVQIVETVHGEGYTRESITFLNLYDERVTAYLYIPTHAASERTREEADRKRPCALALHPTGLPGKQIAEQKHPYAKELAQRGYIVIAPDYPSFGDQKDYDFKTSPYKSGTMKAISDNMRCIDLLQSRADVDKEKIAAIGHSLGGHNALFTAAFDKRIRVTVTSCGWTPFHFYYGGKKLTNWAQDRYMPRIRDVYESNADKIPFDFPDIFAAIAPRAVFSNSPLHDENFDVAGVKQVEPDLQKLFGDKLKIEYPDCAHDFPPEIRRQAYQFIDRELSFKPAREVPE
jgi:predicted dienelactone hydrolase